MPPPNNQTATIDDGLPPSTGNGQEFNPLNVSQSGEGQAISFIRAFNERANTVNLQWLPRLRELENEVTDLLERLNTVADQIATLKQDMGADNPNFTGDERQGG